MTEAVASHPEGLMKKDIEHFADGVRSSGQDPSELRDRSIGGAMGLVEIVGLLTGARLQAGLQRRPEQFPDK